MAGTGGDPNTPEWLLLNDALAYITKYTRSEKAAKELLLDYLKEGRMRWRCWKLEFEKDDHTTLGAYRFFWASETNSQIDVDWDSSSATRSGPGWSLGSHDDETWPIYDQRRMVRLHASLVSLNHDDIKSTLRFVGLMPRSPTPASSSLPSMAQEPPPEDLTPTKEPPPVAREQQAEEPKQPEEPAPKESRKRKPAEWLVEAKVKYPQRLGENKSDWASRLYKQMQKDFGKEIPWSHWKVLRRRLYPSTQKKVEVSKG